MNKSLLRFSKIARVKGSLLADIFGRGTRFQKSELRCQISRFGFSNKYGGGGGRKECQHHWAKPIWYLSDRLRYPFPDFFFHFWCFDCWKVQRGVVVAQKQVGCSSELKSGRSAVSNIDVLFWEIPAARNLDIFSFLLIDVICGWWEGRGGSFLHCRHQIVSASASKLGGFLAKLPSWRGNKMALLKILTLGKLTAMSRLESKIRESCKGQLVTTPPTELWLPNLEVGTLKSELSGLLRKSDRWGRAVGACWEKDPNSGSSWPGQWTHPLAISSDH